jgi:hypothetical protein
MAIASAIAQLPAKAVVLSDMYSSSEDSLRAYLPHDSNEQEDHGFPKPLSIPSSTFNISL